MDRATAIDLLDNLLGIVEDNHDSDYDAALHMGIDALKMQLSIESTTFPVEGATLDCISRQQAILAIERNAYRHTYIDQIVDIIKWLPSVQPKDYECWRCNCKKMEAQLSKEDATFDYIHRQAAIDAVCEYCEYFNNEKVIQRIKGIPSVKPHRMRGTWETIDGWDGDEVYRCSECGEEYVLIDGTPKENGYHFCPNCGADMRGMG